jgi:16S rRNA (guanine527-N7)-methyltransferase
MSEGAVSASERLQQFLVEAGQAPLEPLQAGQFGTYLSLILRWNARVNLTAIRDEDGILSRHFVESIACARALPGGVLTLLDFGSGAGFPGIPIALCRPDLSVTLAESQGKKAAFLQEAARVLGIAVKVHSGRAEELKVQFDCVTLRAVDRIEQAVEAAARLVSPAGWLVLMTTEGCVEKLQAAAGQEFSWRTVAPLANAERELLALGQRSASYPR